MDVGVQACEAQTCPSAVACMHDALRTARLPIGASGLAARALTATACHPACTAQQHSASLQLWRDLLSGCAACPPALTAAMRWFAVFARVHPSADYTSAVPQSLLRAAAPAGSAQGGPYFLQLLQNAQQAAAGSPHSCATDGDMGSTMCAVQASMAAGNSVGADVMGSASGAGAQERAARLTAALQSDIVSLAQREVAASGAPPQNGKGGVRQGDSWKGAAGAGGGGGRHPGGFGSAAARCEALAGVLSTLQQLHSAEAAEGGPMAGGIRVACQQLQAVVNSCSGR